MSITWRPATVMELEEGLRIQPRSRGDALVGEAAAAESWRRLFRDPFSTTAVLESSNSTQGHRLVGFGAAVLLSPWFAAAELARPQPDINGRVVASLHAGKPVLASRQEVARANTSEGVDILPFAASGETTSWMLRSGNRHRRCWHRVLWNSTPAIVLEESFVRRWMSGRRSFSNGRLCTRR